MFNDALPDHPIADVWAHGDYAYVGGFGPNITVKVVDISDPVNPAVVPTIRSMIPSTSRNYFKALHSI